MRYKALLSTSVLTLTVLACTPDKAPTSQLDYYGTDSKEATLEFTASVEFISDEELTEDQALDEADKAARRQVKHLFGTLKEHNGPGGMDSIDFTDYPAVPKKGHALTHYALISMEKNAKGQYVYVYSYKFADKAAFKDKFFKRSKDSVLEQGLRMQIDKEFPNADSDSVQMAKKQAEIKDIPNTVFLRLPKNPSTIYSFGVVGSENKCTDHHYNSEGDFWYFWNPYASGCPESFMSQTILVKSKIRMIESTKETYPVYDRLAEDGVIDIAYVVGPDEDKMMQSDLGRKSFEKTFDILTKGKEIIGESSDLQAGTAKFLASIPNSADLIFKVLEQKDDERTLYAFRDGKKILVQMFFIDPKKESFAFQSVIRDAIMSSDVFIYDGHSGLGGTLPVSRFYADREEKFGIDKYQVLFFNGCSTFAYYNDQYFKQKAKGSADLEIVTTSIGAPWATGAEIDAIFILSFANGLNPSWQKIMDDVYHVNERLSALTQVNGDEDENNKKKPAH